MEVSQSFILIPKFDSFWSASVTLCFRGQYSDGSFLVLDSNSWVWFILVSEHHTFISGANTVMEFALSWSLIPEFDEFLSPTLTLLFQGPVQWWKAQGACQTLCRQCWDTNLCEFHTAYQYGQTKPCCSFDVNNSVNLKACWSWWHFCVCKFWGRIDD